MASDVAIHAEEILRTKKRLNDLYVYHTGRPLEEVEQVVDRDTFMSPEKAIEFGVIDKVIKERNDAAKEAKTP